MAVLAYDDVMLREPRLLVPGQKPLGPVQLNNVARSLQSKVVLMPKLVGPQNLTRMCTNNGGSFGHDGSFIVAARTQYLFVPKALGLLPYLTDFTLRVRYRTTATDLASALLCSNIATSGERSLQVTQRITATNDMGFIVATSAGAWAGTNIGVFPFDIPVDGTTVIDWIGIHQRSLYKTMFINGVKTTTAMTSTTGLENDATHTGWQINAEAGANGLAAGTYELVQAWPFGLSDAECIRIAADPYGMFDPA